MPDVLFHDGEPLNADAVIVNFEAQRGHPLVGLAVKPFFPETGAADKVDDLTVSSTCSTPTPTSQPRGRPVGMVGLAEVAGGSGRGSATLNQYPVERGRSSSTVAPKTP